MMEHTAQFLNQILQDEGLAATVQSRMEDCTTKEDQIQALMGLATGMGYDVTVDEIGTMIARSQGGSEELSDDELDMVAGGVQTPGISMLLRETGLGRLLSGLWPGR